MDLLQLIGLYAAIIISGGYCFVIAFVAMMVGFTETGASRTRAYVVTFTALAGLMGVSMLVTLFATCQTPEVMFPWCR